MKSKCKRLLCALIQLTWGLPQTMIGFVLFLLCRLRGCRAHAVRSAVGIGWHRTDGISLGLFFFCPASDFERSAPSILPHEYGHTIQSLILGPLYPLLVLIPSLIWCGLPAFRRYRDRTGTPYAALFCEQWADYVSQKRF